MKERKKKAKGSLLTRFFKSSEKKKKNSPTRTAKKEVVRQAPPMKPTPPPTAGQRSIAEIKYLMRIGERDPQRLAMLVSDLLAEDRVQSRQDRQAFAQMIEEINAKSKNKPIG